MLLKPTIPLLLRKNAGLPRLPYGTGAALLQCAMRRRVIHNAQNLNRLFVLFACNNLWMRAREGRRLGTCRGITLPFGAQKMPQNPCITLFHTQGRVFVHGINLSCLILCPLCVECHWTSDSLVLVLWHPIVSTSSRHYFNAIITG